MSFLGLYLIIIIPREPFAVVLEFHCKTEWRVDFIQCWQENGGTWNIGHFAKGVIDIALIESRHLVLVFQFFFDMAHKRKFFLSFQKRKGFNSFFCLSVFCHSCLSFLVLLLCKYLRVLVGISLVLSQLIIIALDKNFILQLENDRWAFQMLLL